MKRSTFLGLMLLLLSISISMNAQTKSERIQFYQDYVSAVNDKTSMIKSDPELYQQALSSGWFQQVAAGVKNAENYAYGDFENNGGGTLNPLVGSTCETSEPFCTSTGITYPAGTTGSGQPGPDYGCLQSQPCPAWYYMKILTGGDIHITETNSANVDIDFILWGPFPSKNACTSLTAGTIIDCSFSPQPVEYIDLATSQAGEYYILMVTNFSTQPTNITLAQTSGSGSTDCSIVNPPPPAPVAGGGSSITSNSFIANWGLSTSATGYRIDVALDAGFTNFVSGYNNKDVGNVLSTLVSGLSPGTSYYYRVRAYNANGTSPNSNTIVVTLLATISGQANTCITQTYSYSTQTGMSGYNWSVSAGGTITAGSGTNTISVLWTTTGAKTVSVSYTNTTGNTASGTYNVTVNPLPVPTLTGPANLCAGTTGNVYATQTGMTNYIWTVSAGGTITSGGTSTSSSVTVTWNSSGTQTVTVNYTNSNGCAATTAASFNVTVNPLPFPMIIGPTNICVNLGPYYYDTDPGMTGYSWTVSVGGTITAGQGTSQIEVVWNSVGSQTVSVTYANSFGCYPATPPVLDITVTTIPGDAGEIAGETEICGGEQGVAYSTTPIVNVLFYEWTLPPGATIASGSGTTNITVNFDNYASSGNIVVNGYNLCGPGNSSFLAVSVTPFPSPAGSITGQTEVCKNTSGVVYTVPSISSATNYNWTVPSGATITAGANTPSITVTFGLNAVSGDVSVYGSNACGNGPPSSLAVTVYPKPETPVISLNGNTLTSNTPNGNQWYYEGNPISGATGQTYVPAFSGWYSDVVTLNGCSSESSDSIYVVITGMEELQETNFLIYPVPNNGQFTASIHWPVDEYFTITVYNTLGAKIYETRNFVNQGKTDIQIDLRPASPGVYTVVFYNNVNRVLKRILINK